MRLATNHRIDSVRFGIVMLSIKSIPNQAQQVNQLQKSIEKRSRLNNIFLSLSIFSTKTVQFLLLEIFTIAPPTTFSNYSQNARGSRLENPGGGGVDSWWSKGGRNVKVVAGVNARYGVARRGVLGLARGTTCHIGDTC